MAIFDPCLRRGWFFFTDTGHEIAPNTVANATKIIVLATKIQKLVAKLATRTLWVFYMLPWFFATKWSFKVDESARTIRSVKENRHECYETNMSTSAILDLPNGTLYIGKWNVLFGCADTSLPSQENPSIWRYCIMRFFNYLFFMAPNFLALATTLENLGARWLPAKKVNFVPCDI